MEIPREGEIPQVESIANFEDKSSPKLHSRRDFFSRLVGQSVQPEQGTEITDTTPSPPLSITRRELLVAAATVGITGTAAYVAGRMGLLRTLTASAEILQDQETGVPANPYYWTDNRGRSRIVEFENASLGRSPNNPERIVGTVSDWMNADKTNPPTIYQPWEALYREIQAGVGRHLGIWGVLGDSITPKEFMWTFVTTGDGETMTFSIEVIQNNGNPTIYSSEERFRFNAGLEQRRVHIAGFQATSWGFVVDSSNTRYLLMGWTNKYVPSEGSLYKFPLDESANPMPQAASLRLSPTRLLLPTVRK